MLPNTGVPNRQMARWTVRLSVRAIRVQCFSVAEFRLGSDDLAGLDALRAYSYRLGRIVLRNPYGLQIRQPSALRFRGSQCPRSGVLMSDILAILRALPADCAYVCHYVEPPRVMRRECAVLDFVRHALDHNTTIRSDLATPLLSCAIETSLA